MIRHRKPAITLLLMAIAALALVAGCGQKIILQTTQATKDVAETALYTARVAENTGVITEAQFLEVRAAYDELRLAQSAVIDARIDYLKNPTPAGQAALDAKMQAVTTLMLKIINTCRKYGIGEGVLWSSPSNKP